MILPVSPEAPLLLRAGATALLVLHIGGGTIGLISGFAALAVRKGGQLHRWIGNTFFVSMLIMAAIGATVSPFIHDRVSSVAGGFTLYLLATAWMAVRRPAGTVGRFEVVAMVAVLGVVAAGVTFLMMMAASPDGMVDGAPPPAPYIFATIGALAAGLDLRIILRRGISGAQRVARHLWRMCLALFIASGSLFLGQPQVFPPPLHGSPLLFIPALAPLVFLVFWMLRVRLGRRFRGPPGAGLAAVGA